MHLNKRALTGIAFITTFCLYLSGCGNVTHPAPSPAPVPEKQPSVSASESAAPEAKEDPAEKIASMISEAVSESTEKDAAETESTSDPTEESPVIYEDEDGTYTGVVLDAAMHSMMIQTISGEQKLFSYPEESPDISGMDPGGIRIGIGVKLTVDENDHVTAISSVDTKAGDPEALDTAADLVLAAYYDDFDSFKDSVLFPVETQKGTVKSANELSKDKYWTPEMKEMLSHLNLIALEKTGDSIILSGSSKTPSVTIDKTAEGWYVTRIMP
ncbi:MAG: hypothetical protein K6E33_09845 [Lachnospiraceae bacterium]|nr:hypothetical protein [Lachnospiraceae bacterium]